MALKPDGSVDRSENKDKEKHSGRKDGSLTKVILRRLPPTMTQTELIDQISPLPAYDYFHFMPADYSLAPWAFSRAYINLSNVEDVILFRDRFDGYVFVDNRGNEYSAMVEMAPCPKVPKKTKRDARCGTLEEDEEYKQFVELLKNPVQAPVMSLEQRLEEIDRKEKERKETKGQVKPTPLTEYIKQKKEEKLRKKQQKEEERRKRLEWEKQMREQQEKRRIQREKEKKEREAKREQDRSDVPPRFAAKEGKKREAKTSGGGGAGAAAKSSRQSGWKDDRKQYYDERGPSKCYEKPHPAKKRQNRDE